LLQEFSLGQRILGLWGFCRINDRFTAGISIRTERGRPISNLIPEQVIEEIKSRSELVAVVEQYVRLDKRSGSNFFGLCPFHSEDTPSFSVSPSKQIYYCFGCHKGGNVIHFIMDIEKCSYVQAIQLLADRAGVAIPEPDDEAYRKRSELNRSLQTICLEAARYYFHCLTGANGAPGREYLTKRGVTSQTARKFGLGYALEEWDGLYRHLLTLNYQDDLLMKSGLFKRGKTGGLYDLFRHRLIFPILDAMGRVVAFGGRVLDDSVPKYINSPENPIYTKGRHLYGLNLAKSSRKNCLVMVEGYMDAIAMHQAGVDNTVASLGTALTEQQAQLIRKYTETVIIAYDADAAGQPAAMRGLDILGRRGIKVTVLQVPEGKDPDEYIRRNGPERFHALLEKALPLLDFKLLAARRSKTSGDELDIMAYQDVACQILAQEENAIVRELYANRLAEELNATADTVLREIERRHEDPDAKHAPRVAAPHLVQPASRPASETGQLDSQVTREEIYLLCLLAVNPDLWDQIDSKPATGDFSPGPMQEVAASALALASRRQLDPASLIELGSGFQVRGRPVYELLARASMKLEETFGNQEMAAAVNEQLRRQRLNRLRQEQVRLNQELSATDDTNRRQVIRQALREVTEQLIRLKQN